MPAIDHGSILISLPVIKELSSVLPARNLIGMLFEKNESAFSTRF